MKVLHQDTRTGEIKLLLESMDDLWHLKNIVVPADLVWADTHRRKEEKSDKIRVERAEKRRMRLGIRIDKVEFQDYQDKLRILGVIEEGPQDIGQHHTLLLGPGDKLSIFKSKWKKHELDRIMSAVRDASRPSIYFVSMDETEAAVFVMSQFSLKELGNITLTGTGKMYESKTDAKSYFEEIANILIASIDMEPIVILGPGFAKERFIAFLKEKHPEMAKRTTALSSGQSGATGVYEVIKKGLGGKIVKDTRLVIETNLIEDLLARISRGDPVTYGPKQVEKAAKAGAVEVLLITEERVRIPLGEKLMKTIENMGGRVEILSTNHDAGKRLESLGGYAAILRYPI